MNYTKHIVENQKRRGHALLPQALRAKLPELYSTDSQGDDALAQVRLFGANGWCWYITEFDGEDTCFGLVFGDATEYGYFSLSELESARIPAPEKLAHLPRNAVVVAGYPAVERDLHFQPQSLGEVRACHVSPDTQEAK